MGGCERLVIGDFDLGSGGFRERGNMVKVLLCLSAGGSVREVSAWVGRGLEKRVAAVREGWLEWDVASLYKWMS